MGFGRMSSNDWDSYTSTHTAGKTRAQVFTAHGMNAAYDPKLIGVRESRDSAINPQSTNILIGCDVTGSLGLIAEQLIRKDIPKIVGEIYDRKPITDPHVAVMAIGDDRSDQAPLQVTQFEASVVLAQQIKELWLEGNGGGNGGESYALAHLFAATKTVADSWEKRRNKGVLITIGDEPIHLRMSGDSIARVMGDQFNRDMTAEECVALASKTYEAFHIVLENEGYARSGITEVMRTWESVLPQRVLRLKDVGLLSETIVSILQVIAGERKEDIAASWGKGKDLVVMSAIKDLQVARNFGGASRLA